MHPLQLLEQTGAVAWGVAPAEMVPADEWARFEDWLARGLHAGMDYMVRYKEIRHDPRLLLEGARSIISLAFNYRQPNPYPEIATYALGRDYHRVLRSRLKKTVSELKKELGGEWRICIDSAPILERYWAERCGIGERSPLHGNIVVPGVGSMVFLAELITTLDLPPTSAAPQKLIPQKASGRPKSAASQQRSDPKGQQPPHPCPTGALLPGGIIDSRRCLNYLTIEHRGEYTPEEQRLLTLPGAKGKLFGCDSCQLGCDYNQTPIEILPEFAPLPDMPRVIEALRRGDRNSIPSDSPLKRKQ